MQLSRAKMKWLKSRRFHQEVTYEIVRPHDFFKLNAAQYRKLLRKTVRNPRSALTFIAHQLRSVFSKQA